MAEKSLRESTPLRVWSLVLVTASATFVLEKAAQAFVSSEELKDRSIFASKQLIGEAPSPSSVPVLSQRFARTGRRGDLVWRRSTRTCFHLGVLRLESVERVRFYDSHEVVDVLRTCTFLSRSRWLGRSSETRQLRKNTRKDSASFLWSRLALCCQGVHFELLATHFGLQVLHLCLLLTLGYLYLGDTLGVKGSQGVQPRREDIGRSPRRQSLVVAVRIRVFLEAIHHAAAQENDNGAVPYADVLESVESRKLSNSKGTYVRPG